MDRLAQGDFSRLQLSTTSLTVNLKPANHTMSKKIWIINKYQTKWYIWNMAWMLLEIQDCIQLIKCYFLIITSNWVKHIDQDKTICNIPEIPYITLAHKNIKINSKCTCKPNSTRMCELVTSWVFGFAPPRTGAFGTIYVSVLKRDGASFTFSCFFLN